MQPERTRPTIRLQAVEKSYGTGPLAVRALRGIDLVIDRGDYVAIMGASGSGKSTLMHILGCLDLPTRGRYLLDGIDVRGLDDFELSYIRNRKIGLVFQSFNLIPRTTALRNVELPLVYGRVNAKKRRRLALEALAVVGLADRVQHGPQELSGGQQQRVAIARAIVTDPAMILADEPTGNLDSASTDEILQVFARLNVAGRTLLVITHEAEVAAHAKRIVQLSDGRVVEDTRQAEVNVLPPRFAPGDVPAAAATSFRAPPRPTPRLGDAVS